MLQTEGLHSAKSAGSEGSASDNERKSSRGLDLFAGVDFLHSERSYDVILEVTVKDRDALDRYQKDSYHCGIIKPHMHAVREASVAVDVEIPD